MGGGGGQKAVFYIKFIELFGEQYQSKIAALSQSTVEATNLCTGESANTSNSVDESRAACNYCIFTLVNFLPPLHKAFLPTEFNQLSCNYSGTAISA